MATYKFSKYYIYYEIADIDHKRRIITNDGKLDTIDQYINDYKGYNGIELKFIETKVLNDDILTEYLKFFENWKDECMNNGIYKVDITQGDVKAMQQCFFSLVTGYKNKTTKKLEHDKISATEYKWFQKCANSGLYYLQDEDIELDCWSYDRKACYANILGSKLLIPTKQGCEYTLDKFPEKMDRLKYGFYRAKITYANEDFLKCFVFSKSNVYCDISIKFAFEHKEKFKLSIELIQDDQPNAYLYDFDDMIPICSMTGKWLEKVIALKAKYPKNPYIKALVSGTWGVINQRNKLSYSFDEINEKELDFGLADYHKYIQVGRFTKHKVDYYEMVNSSSAYKYQLRLKPWITAQSRNDIAMLGMTNLGNVIRLQTDSVSFNKNIELNNPNYALESKTTGLIHWYNVNCYWNKTTGYKTKNLK